MLARELRVMRRNFVSTFLRVVLQPLLFVFVFAYVMPKIGPGAGLFGAARGGPTFSTILVPGLVGSAMIMQGMMAVVFPLVMELSWQRSIEDRALAPLPIELLALEKIIAGGTQALIAGLLVFPAVLFVHAEGQAPSVHVGDWPLFLAVLVFGALLASAAGLYLGTVIDPRQMQMLFALVLLPATMLGCVYYPWAALENIRWLQLVVLVNPLVYVSEGLRAVLTPQLDHMPAWAFLLVLVGGTLMLCWLAMRTFTRRVLN
jgi:ABC-2 type transport system permease protein